VNGGRDQIVINESAEGPPGVVDQIDRVVDQLRIVGRILPLTARSTQSLLARRLASRPPRVLESTFGLSPPDCFRCYSSGAIGTMTGFAGAGLDALSRFGAGASGIRPGGIGCLKPAPAAAS
jgi:hypothetical protein